MTFRGANLSRLARFNSSASSDFVDSFEKFWQDEIAARNVEPKHQTFAPSSFRCPRIQWFRLRGVQPDKIKSPDTTLDFTAVLGTAIHEFVQNKVSRMPDVRWIDVTDHLKEVNPDYKYEVTKKGYETQIEIFDPPVRFACDGIIEVTGQRYLLEIKSSEFSSFDDLTNAKPQHVDQTKIYGTLLHLNKVLFLYVDRQYGGLKCYEQDITLADKDKVNNTIKYVQDCVNSYIAPEGLPLGDNWCTRSMCPYFDKCQEWGR